MTAQSINKILIVGAGPSGLLLAVLLGKQNIPVVILEATDKLDEQPRASHYSAPANVELKRAGVLSEIREKGFMPTGVSWRKKDGSVIAKMDNTLPDDYDIYRMVALPLNQVCKILYSRLADLKTVDIKWNHKVISLGQDDSSAWVNVEIPEGQVKMSADYIVGCDGGNSQIRRSLFGDWEFPGTSWEQQIIATNVYYDFGKFGYDDANFIVHPDDWYMAARITKDGCWRVTYGDIGGLPRDEYIRRQPERFATILPGSPKPEDYKLVNVSPYRMHQRLAHKMRVGRFLLAADAAHLCNPFGGLGLTGGIADVGGLYDCLYGIHMGIADPETILDKYDNIRRETYQNFTNPISTANFKRLWDQDPDTAAQNDQFLQTLIKLSADAQALLALQKGVMGLQHDFTQYYKTQANAPYTAM